MLVNLFGLEKGYGYIVFGGMEVNILVVRVMRNFVGIEKFELIFLESVYFLFIKVVEMLGVKFVWVELNDDYIVNVKDVEKKIIDRMIGIVGIVGMIGFGVVDDILVLSDLVFDYGFFFLC